jgi:hypothetical protein
MPIWIRRSCLTKKPEVKKSRYTILLSSFIFLCGRYMGNKLKTSRNVTQCISATRVKINWIDKQNNNNRFYMDSFLFRKDDN